MTLFGQRIIAICCVSILAVACKKSNTTQGSGDAHSRIEFNVDEIKESEFHDNIYVSNGIDLHENAYLILKKDGFLGLYKYNGLSRTQDKYSSFPQTISEPCRCSISSNGKYLGGILRSEKGETYVFIQDCENKARGLLVNDSAYYNDFAISNSGIGYYSDPSRKSMRALDINTNIVSVVNLDSSDLKDKTIGDFYIPHEDQSGLYCRAVSSNESRLDPENGKNFRYDLSSESVVFPVACDLIYRIRENDYIVALMNHNDYEIVENGNVALYKVVNPLCEYLAYLSYWNSSVPLNSFCTIKDCGMGSVGIWSISNDKKWVTLFCVSNKKRSVFLEFNTIEKTISPFFLNDSRNVLFAVFRVDGQR